MQDYTPQATAWLHSISFETSEDVNRKKWRKSCAKQEAVLLRVEEHISADGYDVQTVNTVAVSTWASAVSGDAAWRCQLQFSTPSANLAPVHRGAHYVVLLGKAGPVKMVTAASPNEFGWVSDDGSVQGLKASGDMWRAAVKGKTQTDPWVVRSLVVPKAILEFRTDINIPCGPR
jgi:hypothetical protein